MGASAAITEMLVQSHEGTIDLLPALPDEWANGKFDGVCARGNFELNMTWENKKITELEILSKSGNICRVDAKGKYKVTKDGKSVAAKTNADGSIEFKTVKGGVYQLIQK